MVSDWNLELAKANWTIRGL